MDHYLGEIKIFAGNFAPLGWALCDGSLLSIAMYDTLFALVGTTYGGDGQTTFALPDLRGRAPIHQGTGPGLSPRVMGQSFGTEEVTLVVSQLPSHNHGGLRAQSGAGDKLGPGVPAKESNAQTNTYGAATSLVTMNASAVSAVGGSQPHENMQPYLAINYIIATEGIFPSQV